MTAQVNAHQQWNYSNARAICTYAEENVSVAKPKALAKVLVVEDEPLIRLSLVDSLEDAGFVTLEADNAAQAVALLSRNPDVLVVFTDVRMPGEMDGFALSRHVAEHYPDIAIVICTGDERPANDVVPSKALFINKPYEDSALAKILAAVRVGTPSPSDVFGAT